MKSIEVVAAIIKDVNPNEEKYFVTQRGYGPFAGGWEFPGGKIEQGETKVEALIREIKEELDVRIEVKDFFHTVEYDYDTFHLTMHCYICKLIDHEIKLLEHANAKWLAKDQLNTVDWLTADIEIIEKLRKE